MDPASTAAAVGGASTDAITAMLYGLGMITTTICGVAITYIKMKSTQKRDVGPQPFEVRATEEYVKCKDCIARHLAMDKAADEHKQDNKDAHENMFFRLTSFEKFQGTTEGKLDMLIDTMKRVEIKVDAL